MGQLDKESLDKARTRFAEGQQRVSRFEDLISQARTRDEDTLKLEEAKREIEEIVADWRVLVDDLERALPLEGRRQPSSDRAR
ncbi:hypothetical protein IHQ68_13810 [Chelatococcus sambhunathii]|uniref:Uncharacterized protein n=1 Tax=Chelatococcus sambhunathii TaxID=363953 RepID=A0ABU1DHU1_9HYPH|nr:hypothetical protein [Chelatococcus sambhunathii]MDR4307694.1 hypothetical protein [Chelatococcus sambhunathii]